MTVLKNCRLIPFLTEGSDLRMADIVIDDGKISSLEPCGRNSYEGIDCIDVGGKTAMPGYFDLHAHLMFSCQNWEYLIHRPQNIYLMETAAYAKQYLKLGYTTIRDAGNDHYASVTVRDYIANGTLTGARVITSGKILSPTTKGNSSFGTLYKEIDGPEAMLKAVREEVAAGVDFIKYMSTGAVLNLGGVPGQMITTPEELRAIVEAADRLGTYVASHCHGTQGIKEAIKAGIRTIEHASYMDEECVELILKGGNVISTIPTLAVTYSLRNEYSGPVLPEFREKSMDAEKHMAASMRMCCEGGVLVGFGTDLDLENAAQHPGIEFLARAEHGIDPETVLKQATINSAKIVHMEDRLGTICRGKLADIVIIDGKPDEDLSCMVNYPAMVFKEGKRIVD